MRARIDFGWTWLGGILLFRFKLGFELIGIPEFEVLLFCCGNVAFRLL